MTPKQRPRTHPKERLASPVQQFHLAEAAARLRTESHAGIAGHRQLTLVRRGPVAVILFVFQSGASLKPHQVDGEVIIHVLNGRLIVDVAGEEIQLGARELVSLASGHTHAVRALEETEMLLTICRAPS
jgi:quercetin dioxygenase-like cupin family protein